MRSTGSGASLSKLSRGLPRESVARQDGPPTWLCSSPGLSGEKSGLSRAGRQPVS